MIASSTVSSDGTSVNNLFTTYSSEIATLESKDVWEGKSQANAISQAEKFVSEFSSPINSQFTDFSSAASKYKEWEAAKKNYENAQIELSNAQQRKNSNPKAYIDISSYQRKVNEYKDERDKLKQEIETLLNNVKSKKIDISATTVKTPDSYKLYDFVNYYQYNYQQSYGYGSTIANAGCGPTSMAMVVTYLTGETHDPVELANWSLANGHRVPGNGSSWTLFPGAAKKYGIECEQMSVSSSKIIETLKSGRPMIMSMAPGHFTSGGHFIVLRGLTSDGKVIVADPASEKRSNQVWDAGLIASEAKGMWAFDSDKTQTMEI